MMIMNINMKLTDSLKPRDVYVRHQTRSSSVQVVTYHLLSAEPLTQPMNYCQLDIWEHALVKFESFYSYCLK